MPQESRGAALVFFDQTHRSAADLARLLAASGFDVHLISPNAGRVYFLRLAGFSAHIPRDFLDEEDVRRLDRESFDLDESLFEHNGLDHSFFGGVSLMGLAQYALVPPLVRARRDICSALRAIERFSPARIIIMGRDSYTDAARLVCRQSGRAFEEIKAGRLRAGVNALLELYRQRGRGWNQTPFKYLVLEWVLEIWMLAEGFWARIRRGDMDSSKNGPRLVFVGDTYSGFDLHGMLKGSKDWELHACGMDFRLRRRLFPDVRPIEVFFRPGMLLEMLRARMRMGCQWAGLRRDPSYRARFEIEGIPAWPLLEAAIGRYVKYYLPRLYLDYLIGREAFKARPGQTVLVVPADVMPYTKALVLAARAEGAKSLVVQHAFVGFVNGHDRLYADMVAAWGEATTGWYAGLGNDPAKITVIGSPRYDAYIKAGRLSMEDAARLRVELGIGEGKTVVTVLSTWYNDFTMCDTPMDDLMTIEHTLKAICELGLSSQCSIVIKTHPATPGLVFERQMERWRKMVSGITLTRHHLRELMGISSFCVGHPGSTTTIEGMLCGTPFVTYMGLRYLGGTYADDLERFGAAVNTTSYEGIRDAIKGYMLEPGFRERVISNHAAYLEYCLNPRDGHATERLYELVSSITAAGGRLSPNV